MAGTMQFIAYCGGGPDAFNPRPPKAKRLPSKVAKAILPQNNHIENQNICVFGTNDEKRAQLTTEIANALIRTKKIYSVYICVPHRLSGIGKIHCPNVDIGSNLFNLATLHENVTKSDTSRRPFPTLFIVDDILTSHDFICLEKMIANNKTNMNTYVIFAGQYARALNNVDVLYVLPDWQYDNLKRLVPYFQGTAVSTPEKFTEYMNSLGPKLRFIRFCRNAMWPNFFAPFFLGDSEPWNLLTTDEEKEQENEKEKETEKEKEKEKEKNALEKEEESDALVQIKLVLLQTWTSEEKIQIIEKICQADANARERARLEDDANARERASLEEGSSDDC